MELSEEEKAIETLKEVASDDFDTLGDDISPKMAQNILNVIEKQQKEIEEQTTILLAGAEKVKQLEKGNRSLMESRIKWKNRYYKEKEKNKENQVLIDDLKEHRIVYIDTPEFEEKFISKDKIREKIKELENETIPLKEDYKKYHFFSNQLERLNNQIKILEELLEEN